MKYALITGASGGIGTEIAKKLAKEGFHLYLHYNKNEAQIDLLQSQIETNSWKVQADLSLKSGVEKLIMTICHRLDVIVLNSGDSYSGLLTDMTDFRIEEMIQLHLTSPILITKALLPKMISNKKGKVIVISSIWGETGASCEVVYSALKGGLNTFVKALAKEVAPSQINVNGIAPGAINTHMLADYSSEDLQALCEEIPMGRLGKASEVAELVLFLASDNASYVNGQIIRINGAWYC